MDYKRFWPGAKIYSFNAERKPRKTQFTRCDRTFWYWFKRCFGYLCERNSVGCHIQSYFEKITTSKISKQGFGDVSTLHAVIEETEDDHFTGTVITLRSVADEEIYAAKNMFLAFSGDKVIDTTKYGQIISNSSGAGKIFINGVLVVHEENSLFSYNITQISSQLKKAINRERTHVGRSTYTDTVKKILLSSSNKYVADL